MKSKRHHFLPQSYQGRFLPSDGSGMLWVYDKQDGEPRQQKPLNTAVEGHLYSVTIEDGEKDDFLESTILKELDGRAKSAFDRLEDSGFQTNEIDLTTIADFIAIMYARVPRNMRMAEERALAIVKSRQKYLASNPEKLGRFLERFHEDNPGMPAISVEQYQEDIKEIDRRFKMTMNPEQRMLMSLSASKLIFQELMTMRWELVIPPNSYQFITCDAPVVSFRSDGKGRAAFGGGFAAPEIEVFFPVSPSIGIFIDRKPTTTRIMPNQAFVREMNRRLAYNANRFVYSTSYSSYVAGIVEDFSYTVSQAMIDPEELTRGIDWSTFNWWEDAADFCEGSSGNSAVDCS
jgi:hypothetical protein